MGRALVHRIGDAIREDEPAFGISVDDLDRLAARAGYDIAGLDRLARWHVLGGRNNADDVDLWLELGDRQHGADHGGAATHVGFHLLHVQGRLDRDPAAVERDALTDQGQRRATLTARRVSQDDHLGGLVRAAGHREQGTHLHAAHLVHVQNFDVEAGRLDRFLHLFSEYARREGVRRGIHPLPNAIGRFG